MHSHTSFKFCPNCATPLVVSTHAGVSRETCPVCGWVHHPDPKVAAGVLLQRGHEVLLVRRVMEPYLGLWSIPAGFVNAYEDPQNAALRECFEETGLTAVIIDLFEVLSGREHPRGADILLVYRAEICAGNLAAADDADAAEWFDLDALPPLAFETTRKVLDKLSHLID